MPNHCAALVGASARRSIAVVVCTAGLSGCFTSSIVLTVRPDGSGTLEQRAVIKPAAMLEFQKLAAPGLATDAADRAALARDFQRGLENAVRTARLRRDSRVRSALPVNTGDETGWVLAYDFDDVTAIDLDLVPQLPGMISSYGVPIAPKARQAGASTTLKTTLEPVAGGLQRLTFHIPRFALDTTAEPPAAWATGSAAEMAALRKLMAGSRITFAVESASPIVRTNSTFREDNRIVLLDADVEEALFSKEIGTLATTPATFQELLNAFADLPGVRLARDPDVWIEFENPSTRFTNAPAPAQAATTDTEIFLASLRDVNGDLRVGAPSNITNNPGYDNQPSFTPDGQQILFASTRGTSAAGRGSGIPATDIYRYEIAMRRMWRVTDTVESEFTPAVMPDGKQISFVRVEGDGAQRLWRMSDYTVQKREAAPILPDVKRVGYYAWMNEQTVALFVLGEPGQPASLRIADVIAGTTQHVASNIGRSIQRMPSGSIAFVQHESGAADRDRVTFTRLFKSESGTFQTEPIVQPPAPATDPPIAWLPDGTLLTVINDALYQWRPQRNGWRVVANLANFNLHDVSRIAVSPKADRIAIVAAAR